MRLDPQTLAHIRAVADEARAIDAEDDVLLVDTIEGETDALEMMDGLIDAAQHAVSLEAAARERAQRLGERARRLADQGKTYRRALLMLLEAMDLKRVVRPGATLSVSAGRTSLEVVDPAEVPSQLRKPGEPDKAAIKRLVEAGEDVPGARLVEGPATLSVRIA